MNRREKKKRKKMAKSGARLPLILSHSYEDIEFDKKTNTKKAKCKYCDEHKSATGSSTSNFRRHIESTHKEQ